MDVDSTISEDQPPARGQQEQLYLLIQRLRHLGELLRQGDAVCADEALARAPVEKRREAWLGVARHVRDQLDLVLGLEPHLDVRTLAAAQDRALGAVVDQLSGLARNVHSVRSAMHEACNWDEPLQVPDPPTS